MKNTFHFKHLLFFSFLLLYSSCATYKTKIAKKGKTKEEVDKSKSEEVYSVYLLGDAGKYKKKEKKGVFEAVSEKLKNETKKSAVIFLGDNIYPNGMPNKDKKNKEERKKAEKSLDAQLDIVKNYKGKTIFIPGNHDWRYGLKGIERQAKYIEKKLKNKTIFFPENGCPLQKVKINDELVIITIDSQWYLTDWDKEPTINDNCSIKTRDQFFEEFESLIKKSNGKTTIVAMHHPLYSDGIHGGQFSLKQQLKPFPILGSLASFLRKTGGVSPQDLQSQRYLDLRKKLIAISHYNPKVVFVSGHEHNLQYIFKNSLPQIISGSGSKKTPTRRIDCDFAYNDFGFAKFIVYKDGSSIVQYFGIENNKEKLVYQTQVFSSQKATDTIEYRKQFPSTVKSSIYTKEEVTKSGFRKMMWGKRYRDYYAIKIEAPTVNLDTLFGGLTPKRRGGGHQSVSLILTNPDKKEYVLRALKKSATKYLQAVAFKNQYIGNELDNTLSEDLILDVFTGSHPYAPFTIATLSDAINVYHPNPVLYYVPKQNALKGFNNDYGNQLYMIEERVASGHGDVASFGYSNTIISTNDMFKKLRKSKKYSVDKEAFVRARLFDMVIGDWDRHSDQWRWAKFKIKEDSIMYKPVPRDRDQAFSKMDDGFVMKLLTTINPTFSMLKSYKEDLKNPKGFNTEPYSLDVALLCGTEKNLWDEQVSYIKSHLTEEIIDNAFKQFPSEVIDKTIEDIKQKLMGRIARLQDISDNYYNVIHKHSVIKGTDKKDWFIIKRFPNGKTTVSIYSTKKMKKPYYQFSFSSAVTKELLIFGLDDKDYFEVVGSGNKMIPITLIGGQNNDVYQILNGKKVTIRDYKTKENTFLTHLGRKLLTNDYEVNVYFYKKANYTINQVLPTIDFNKDDGFKIGIKDMYITKGFHQDHFIQNQTLTAYYFTATSGFEIKYNGLFNKLIGKYKLTVDGLFTSPNYTLNFFGFGNQTENMDANLGKEYNRVRVKTIAISPSLVNKGVNGSSIKASIGFEIIAVEETLDRYITEDFDINNTISNLFENQYFIGASLRYQFKNTDDKTFPTLGLISSLEIGFKNNLDTTKSFGYIIPVVGFDYKLLPSGKLVFATKVQSHINLGDSFTFYQAASIGANNGLRGYRNQRFTGKYAYTHTSDIRYRFNKLKTRLLPINLGIFAGFDYGRVWVNNDASKYWHTSYGGGMFVDVYKLVSAKFGVFTSSEENLFSFGLNMGF